MSRALIVFAKSPSGDVKTRLSKALDPEARVDLYTRLLENTLAKLRGLPRTETFVYFTPAGAGEDFKRFGLPLRPQSTGDLGRRMHSALAEVFEEGFSRAALVGTDIPEISAGVIAEAFELLEYSDLVLGPAEDGGYYLVALKEPREELFSGIPWSSPDTLRASLDRAVSLGLSVGFTGMLRDLDTPEDLAAHNL